MVLITVKLDANKKSLQNRWKKGQEIYGFNFFAVLFNLRLNNHLAILVKVSNVIKATFFCSHTRTKKLLPHAQKGGKVSISVSGRSRSKIINPFLSQRLASHQIRLAQEKKTKSPQSTAHTRTRKATHERPISTQYFIT